MFFAQACLASFANANKSRPKIAARVAAVFVALAASAFCFSEVSAAFNDPQPTDGHRDACLCDNPVGSLQADGGECGDAVVKLMTSADNPSLAIDTAVVAIKGPITPATIDQVLSLGDRIKTFKTLIFDLDSPGGRFDHSEQLASILRSLSDSANVKTYVRHGSRCLSGCVLVFQQGEERIAGGSSSWLFHAACAPYSYLPLPSQTKRFVDLLIAAGASEEFLSELVDRGYLTVPGEYWLSGYELFDVHKANIITKLLDPWRPLKRSLTPPD